VRFCGATNRSSLRGEEMKRSPARFGFIGDRYPLLLRNLLEQAFKPLPDLDYEGVPVRPVGGFGAETGIVTVMSGQGVDSPAAFTEQTS
jgi:hypothetical protein